MASIGISNENLYISMQIVNLMIFLMKLTIHYCNRNLIKKNLSCSTLNSKGKFLLRIIFVFDSKIIGCNITRTISNHKHFVILKITN